MICAARVSSNKSSAFGESSIAKHATMPQSRFKLASVVADYSLPLATGILVVIDDKRLLTRSIPPAYIKCIRAQQMGSVNNSG